MITQICGSTFALSYGDIRRYCSHSYYLHRNKSNFGNILLYRAEIINHFALIVLIIVSSHLMTQRQAQVGGTSAQAAKLGSIRCRGVLQR